jgi:hypothetical protein
VSPPGIGKQLTVPEALSCSKEFDMIAIVGWVSQSTMLWLWYSSGFGMWRKEEENLVEFKSETPLSQLAKHRHKFNPEPFPS